MSVFRLLIIRIKFRNVRKFSRTSSLLVKRCCKLLVAGGGAGGCTIAANFAGRLNRHEIIIVEPADMHYNQSMFTLVGGGMKTLAESSKTMLEVLPDNAIWMKDSVVEFHPKQNCVITKGLHVIKYDFLVVAIGLVLQYEKIPGLLEALQLEDSGVCSNYSPKFVEKTLYCMKHFNKGNAIFTVPKMPVKCPGAGQKAAYIMDAFLRKNNKRHRANIIYTAPAPVLFGVQKYADTLWKIVEERNIFVHLKTKLIAVDPWKKIATFENLDKPEIHCIYKYEMLHVVPPNGPPQVLKDCEDLVNRKGYVEVNKNTLQSTRFSNVFAIGDCAGSPNSKTAASVASQSKVVTRNLAAVMNGKHCCATYLGYASCPLITGYDKCVLAEFDYALQPMETFPFNQAKERRSMFLMKKEIIPQMYWLMLKGYWRGPSVCRKILHCGLV